MVSIIEAFCRTSIACLQCIAESVLTMDDPVPPDVAARWRNAVEMGLFTEEDVKRETLYGVRQFRLVARMVLLEPHECGRAGR